jgi:hypothetical protein
MSFLSPKADVGNTAYKYKTVTDNSSILLYFLMFTGSIFGSAVARMAMTVSLIIQLFHKFVLFNTEFGKKLNYFLTATTNLMEGEEEEDGPSRILVSKWKSDKLVAEAELNVSTIDAFGFDMVLMLGFFLLRYVRAL